MQLEPIARAGKLYVHESLIEWMREWEQFPDGLTDVRKRNRRSNHYDMLDATTGCVPDVRNFSMVTDFGPRTRNTADDLIKALKARSQGIPMDVIRSRYYGPD